MIKLLIGMESFFRGFYSRKIKMTKRKVQQGLDSRSKRIQFPKDNNELLANGKHRYFVKYGVRVDRTTI